jgi:Bacterial Ig-like domain
LSNNERTIKSKSSDKISFNSRAILLALFALVGFVLLVFAVAVVAYPSQGIGRLNTVFIAAISGSLALGGTLISQLWGKEDVSNSPIVYSKTPVEGAANVSVNTEVSALFNKTMNEATINDKTFILKDDESSIEAQVTLEGGNAKLKPSKPLTPSTKYTVTISKDVKDIEGNSMDSEVIWTFTTEPD